MRAYRAYNSEDIANGVNLAMDIAELMDGNKGKLSSHVVEICLVCGLCARVKANLKKKLW